MVDESAVIDILGGHEALRGVVESGVIPAGVLDRLYVIYRSDYEEADYSYSVSEYILRRLQELGTRLVPDEADSRDRSVDRGDTQTEISNDLFDPRF